MYTCVCGKSFNSVYGLNGHKQGCRIYLGDKYDEIITERRNRRKKAREEHPEKYKSWNKGLTKETDERIRSTASKISKTLKQHPPIGRCLDADKENERREKIRKSAVARGLGGYVKGSGRGRKGYYKGIWCDSGWELAYVMYNLDHNIPFKRNTDSFPYEYQGEHRTYTPDFYENDCYIEIKGREWYIDEYKYPSCPNLKILRHEEMKPYLDYAIATYGDHYASDNLTKENMEAYPSG